MNTPLSIFLCSSFLIFCTKQLAIYTPFHALLLQKNREKKQNHHFCLFLSRIYDTHKIFHIQQIHKKICNRHPVANFHSMSIIFSKQFQYLHQKINIFSQSFLDRYFSFLLLKIGYIQKVNTPKFAYVL